MFAETEKVVISLVNRPRSERLESRPFTVQNDRVWRFDLRQARSWCEASGLVETLDVVVRAEAEFLYRGAVLEIRPEWDLHPDTFQVSYNRDDSSYIINWQWDESGPRSNGRLKST